MRVLFAAADADWAAYRDLLPRALAAAGVAAELSRSALDPAAVEAIVTVPGAIADFAPYTGCRLVQSLWAGVERITSAPGLTQPLARMVDPGMAAGMADYVAGHVLRLHLGLDAHLAGQDGVWRGGVIPPLSRDRPVGVLGLGEIGGAVAAALAGLGFPVAGWSRRPAARPGIACHHGPEGLRAVLAQAQILVTLLPDTPATRGLLDAVRLGWLPRGAMIVNPGRGTLIDEAALLDALDTGHLAQATLDVFGQEPLPPAHPFWAHPRVTVTPHVAAATRPQSAAAVVAQNLARLAAGAPLLHLVDRARGY